MFDSKQQLISEDWNHSSDRDWAEVLRGLPLFSAVPKRRLRKIVRRARFAEFADGESVVVRGDSAESFYVILSGAAQAYGKKAARTLGVGDYFGELALLDGEPRSTSVIALGELHVMRVPGSVFFELVEENPAVALTIVRELGASLRRHERIAARAA